MKHKIRICVHNHLMKGASDQLSFMQAVFSAWGYSVRISRRPDPDALNILIENFNENNVKYFSGFSKKYSKKFAVVMTEHIDMHEGEIYFHGQKLGTMNEYMHPAMQHDRLVHLIEMREHINCLITLGDLPALFGFDKLFPGLPICRLPYPHISPRIELNSNPKYDFVFFGRVTSYRRRILSKIGGQYRILVPEKLVSKAERDRMVGEAYAVLNLPQDENWKWISSMRVLAGWAVGRPVVNVSDKELEGEISHYCYSCSVEELCHENFVLKNEVTLEKQIGKYHDYLVDASMRPFANFDLWHYLEDSVVA